ncbi:hypothetical protein V5P93_000314 [Actinokineospora auranticolor]|uniref:Uncharacterized protein n=1 Tax=Actinokineospora auranticolor TaxID=155976 RepID=A0A2S6GKN1_9PSEU|nr:hypothetical protein [Actinokineospora auranticolor]PPK65798.1 hypothetical protein CLV40_11259 [Actinokineospora auranticolor]
MSSSIRRFALVVASLGAMVAVTVVSVPAQASEGGPLCHVDRNTWVFDSPGGKHVYTIDAGGGFRLHEVRGDGYALGHGNGHSDGYIVNDGRIQGCHY